jgi:iron only hydrogenase large subunit-like protein
LEASRRTIRSYVDFVLTFEELGAMFEAKNVELETIEACPVESDATGAGRGYAVSGGVASAIEQCIKEYYPETEVNIYHAEGLADCKKMLLQAKAGKIKGCLIEGMGCPGGCVAGVGTVIAPEKAKIFVDMSVKGSSTALPSPELEETAERLTKMK